MKLVSLGRGLNQVLVNPQWVVGVYSNPEDVTINLLGGTSYRVKETLEGVKEKLEGGDK